MIYLDHASTTGIRSCAFDAMRPWLEGSHGNPSSMHDLGRQARQALEDARDLIADKINCRSRDIVFTSGGTEANNLAMKGVIQTWNKPKKLLVGAMDHPSIVETAEFVDSDSSPIIWVSPNSQGLYDASCFEPLMDDDTGFVTSMMVNNEIGNVNDIKSIVELCEGRDIHVHTDAVQAVGHIAVDFEDLGVDSLSLNGHKIGGPAGVGALVIRRQARIATVQRGGGQELGKRGGTENLIGILGMAAAIKESVEALEERRAHWKQLRDLLLGRLSELPTLMINTNIDESVLHVLNVSFKNLDGESLIIRLDMEGVCLSSGSACHADHPEPSHVLKALGRSKKEAAAALRFSFGPDTTAEEVEKAASLLVELIPQMTR